MSDQRTPTFRVLVVDDSDVARDILCMLFGMSTDFEVVAVASDGRQAVQLAERLAPDLITMDLHMPVMDGFEAVEHIMASHPAAILVITSYREAETAFRCINLGALDVIDKPDLDCLDSPTFVHDFLDQARLLASTRVIRRPMLRHGTPASPRPLPVVTVSVRPTSGRAAHLVAIAASTGGPQALSQVLSGLPHEFPAAVLIVQHLAAGFEDGLVSWLGTTTSLPVALAVHGAPLVAGHVFVARPGQHVGVDDFRSIQFIDAAPVAGHRPSAKFLFETAAAVYGPECTGVILTGMGDDGAEALGHIKMTGGLTIAQDEASSTIYGMPKVAAELQTAGDILPIGAIADRITRWVMS